MGRPPGDALLKARRAGRMMARAAKDAHYKALIDAADAWDAMSPEERHEFVITHQMTVARTSLPSAWLRARAYEGGRTGEVNL